MEVLNRWKSERRKFLIKMTVFAFIFYISLPISIGLFPEFMGSPRFDWISIAWIYGFAQILMTWFLGQLYWWKSKELDALLVKVERETEAAE